MDSTRPRVPPLRTIYFYMTGSCNLSCRHCWIDPVRETGAPTGGVPWASLRPIFEEALDLGLRSVKLTGGEPMLHPEFARILLDLKALGLAIRMETNGTLIGKEEAGLLRECAVDFSISVDGPTPEIHDGLRGVPGAFERTLDGIRAARGAGLSFQIITCLHRGNRDSLPAMIALAGEIGAGSLKVNPVTASERSNAMKARGELLSVAEVLAAKRELHDRGAGGGSLPVIFDVPPAFRTWGELARNGLGTCGILGILGVLHDGHAALCGVGENRKEMDFGDLLADGLRSIWESNPVLSEIRERVPEQLGGMCGRCAFRNYCLGKCLADTLVNRGDLLAGFGFCEEAAELGLFPPSRVVEHRRREHPPSTDLPGGSPGPRRATARDSG